MNCNVIILHGTSDKMINEEHDTFLEHNSTPSVDYLLYSGRVTELTISHQYSSGAQCVFEKSNLLTKAK